VGTDGRGAQAVEAGEEQQVVLQGHLAVEARLVEHDAHARPYLVRLAAHIVPSHARRSRGGREQRGQHLQRRRLAGAVRSQQRQYLAGRDAQRHALDGRERAEAAAQVFCLDQLLHALTIRQSR